MKICQKRQSQRDFKNNFIHVFKILITTQNIRKRWSLSLLIRRTCLQEYISLRPLEYVHSSFMLNNFGGLFPLPAAGIKSRCFIYGLWLLLQVLSLCVQYTMHQWSNKIDLYKILSGQEVWTWIFIFLKYIFRRWSQY